MAFNGQGQWIKSSWGYFQKWSENQFQYIDQKLHLLRFRSAVARRRLASLLQQLPPNFDSNAQQNSFAVPDASGNGDDGIPVFTAEWKPQSVTGLGPTVIPPNKNPKASTGVPVKAVKDYFYREIRGIEYIEYRIQKLRHEVEQIESEIYWLECGKAKITDCLAKVNSQFSDPAYRDSLLPDNSVNRLNILAPFADGVGQKYREGEVILRDQLKSEGTVVPANVPNRSGIGPIIGQTVPDNKNV